MIAKYFAPVCMLAALSTGTLWAQIDLLTYAGVWSTVPITGLSAPSGVVGDTQGNLYVTDSSLGSVIKLTSSGTQSTLGSGLVAPEGVAVDADGNVYVTSAGNNKVFKITAGGTQTAIGSGWSSPWSIDVDASGTVWVTDDNGLSTVTTGNVQTVVVLDSNLRGLTIDSNGNVYYGANGSGQIFKIAGGTGSPSSQDISSYTQGLFVDANGVVYNAQNSGALRRYDTHYGDYTLLGDTQNPTDVWGDGHQNLYIADANGLVEKVAMGPVDFGSVHVCPTGATVTPCSSSQTLHFALDNVVNSAQTMSALSAGTPGLDYTFTADGCSGSLTAGGTCAVTVSFMPQAAGLRPGQAEAVGSSEDLLIAQPVGTQPHIQSTVQSRMVRARTDGPNDLPSGTLLASVPLHGIGLAPLAAFDTAPIQSGQFLTMPGAQPSGLTVSSINNFYVIDKVNCVVQLNTNASGQVFTIAGTVCGTPAGDGGPGANAVLSDPRRVAVDGAGNVFIADGTAHTVREVNAFTGNISTIVGSGASGYSGDGGLASNAEFGTIAAIVLDADGNGYIADSFYHVVRRVDQMNGIVTTIAGSGAAGYSGDNGPATSAKLSSPEALALDLAGNLYIAETGNNVIRKLVLSTGVITTVAGTGTAGYSGDGGAATSAQISDPKGISADVAGNLYIADANNFVVRKLDVVSGRITTAAGKPSSTTSYSGDGGPAVLAGLGHPADVSTSPEGILIISDPDNLVIRGVFQTVGLANFGPIALGSQSAAQDTTLSNVGNLPLVFSGLQVPADYSLGGANTTCTANTTLAMGASCRFGIEFVPTADGPLIETVQVITNFNNIPGAQLQMELIGTGTGSVPAKLAFIGALSPIAAGGKLGTVILDVEDAGGNLVSGATSIVTLTLTGPGGYTQSVTVTAINGVASFNLNELPLSTAGPYTLTATSPNLAQAQTTASVTGANPATPVALAIPGTVPTSISAGQSLGVVPVDIQNLAGTLLAAATNTVTLIITGPEGYTHSVTAAAIAGVASFDLSALPLTAPGTYTLTATSAGLVSAIATVTVTENNPVAPAALALATAVPATVASGGNLGSVTVDVNSSAGTVLVSATIPVTLTLTGPGDFTYSVTQSAVNGVASFDLSAVTLTAAGTYTLTATSGRLTSAIATFTVTVDFTIVVTADTASSSLILPGSATAFHFTLAPATGSFSSLITLTATGLPPGATYSFSPAMVTPGASPTGTVMSIQTLRYGSASLRTGAGTLVLALLLLPFTAWRRARRSWRGAGLLYSALPLLLLGAVAGLSGCGAGGLFGHPQAQYTITVTGTSGQISHSATVTLTVQ